MNILHSWNYFLKRVFAKWGTWLILFLHLLAAGLFIVAFKKESSPTITTANDFFGAVFWILIVLPLVFLVYTFSPLSWLPWLWIDDLAQKTQKDGTDLFFLTTEVPTNRKQIFWRKVVFTISALFVVYFIAIALPLVVLLWKINYFSNFTGLQTFLFLTCNFLVIPLLFFVPLFVFLFALASLKSVWYTIFKWISRLSFLLIILLVLIVGQVFWDIKGGRKVEEGIGTKIIKLALDLWGWLKQNYLFLVTTIIGIIIALAALTLFLAYKKFQEEDLN